MAEDKSVDVAIVGAGVAGALIADKLSGRGLKVLVLEAGQRFERHEILEKQQSIWQQDNSSLYPNTALAPRNAPDQSASIYMVNHGEDDYSSHYLRGVGGTTWHWQGVCIRFSPADMEINTRYGVGIDWPFSYDVLEPYYAQAEIELGVSGDTENDMGSPRSTPYPMPPVLPSFADKQLMEALRGSGVEFRSKPAARNSQTYDSRPPCQGHHNCSNMCPVGAQYSAIVHVNKAEENGAEVISEALVTRVDVDDSNQVVGLDVKRSDNSTFRVKAKAYVIAANPVETVRLLLASTNDKLPNGVANSSGKVGRRVMDHFNTGMRFEMPYPVYPGRGPLTSIATTHLREGDFRKEQGSALLGFENIDLTSEVATDALNHYPHDPVKLDKMIRHHLSRRLYIGASVEQLPEEDNRIWLDFNKTDSTGMPQIQITYRLGDYAKRGRAAAHELTHKVVEHLQGKVISTDDVGYVTHTCGTMMMGKDSNKFAVDPDGRTYDHRNLFIAGGSLFPSISAINPTLTIAALALKTEREIARQLAG